MNTASFFSRIFFERNEKRGGVKQLFINHPPHLRTYSCCALNLSSLTSRQRGKSDCVVHVYTTNVSKRLEIIYLIFVLCNKHYLLV